VWFVVRRLCDELIARPEESYRLWSVVMCNVENLKTEDAMARVGRSAQKKICYRKQEDTSSNSRAAAAVVVLALQLKAVIILIT